jgi:hypothetical protein
MRKVIKYIVWIVGGLFLLIVVSLLVLYLSADMKQPNIDRALLSKGIVQRSDSLSTLGNDCLRQDESGLWELYVQGDAAERGVAYGRLMQPLMKYQEKVFVDQIHQIVPSNGYLKFLRFFIILFNRNLGANVPQEYRTEIAGISASCTHEYDAIGTPYERQLNYHAAHDIGHAMQDYMLVGCSSFAVWNSESADSSLLIGRNFDFYVGDEFARNKLVTFCAPDKGYKFVSVGWPGMIGVLSGMNEKGLTITLNAAKSSMPFSSATPISILAREILQYASTIDEAYAIAKKRRTFVSESLLIGSAKDKRAAIIEKSPEKIALFKPDGEQIICTNHFQSSAFAKDKRNIENIATSDSPYRWLRIHDLLKRSVPLTPSKAAAILRDYRGTKDQEIGLTNEKSINQFICNHSVIFQPEKHRIFVSTSPWQIGKYVAYNLDSVFAHPQARKMTVDKLAIPADTMLNGTTFLRLMTYKRLSAKLRKGDVLPQDSISLMLAANPEYYYAWEQAADWYWQQGKQSTAVAFMKKALQKEIPRADIKKRMIKQFNTYDKTSK